MDSCQIFLFSGLLNYNSIYTSSDIWYGLGYSIIALCVVEKILRDIQGVFIIFGAWRNSLFPSTVQSARIFQRRKLLLKPLGIIRRGIVNWGEFYNCIVGMYNQAVVLV